VPAPVDVQQHPRQRPPFPPPPVHPALAFPPHQPCSLQRFLHPRIAQPNLMLLAQLLVKMSHVQIEILLLVQPPAPARPPPAARAWDWLSHPTIQHSLIPMLPIPPMQPPHIPVAHAQNLSCLPPGNLLRHRSQNDFLYFHHPLHGGPRIAVHARPPACIFFPSRLFKADISCANSTGHIMCYQQSRSNGLQFSHNNGSITAVTVPSQRDRRSMSRRSDKEGRSRLSVRITLAAIGPTNPVARRELEKQ